jgi:plastocyanin
LHTEEDYGKPGTFTIVGITAVALVIALSVGAVLVLRLTPPPYVGGTSSVAGFQIVMPPGVGANKKLNFSPPNVTLVIGVNNTIVFVNQDTQPHTATSTAVPKGATSFNSQNMNQGQAFAVTLTVPGEYKYDCAYHPDWMKGTIIVKAR